MAWIPALPIRRFSNWHFPVRWKKIERAVNLQYKIKCFIWSWGSICQSEMSDWTCAEAWWKGWRSSGSSGPTLPLRQQEHSSLHPVVKRSHSMELLIKQRQKDKFSIKKISFIEIKKNTTSNIITQWTKNQGLTKLWAGDWGFIYNRKMN